jgi:cytochrome c nitrite reductase small subunit
MKVFRRLRALPFPFWLALFLVVGGVIGLGGYTFLYAKGTSYFSDDASACANCHVMREVYDSWNRGSHKAVAACNDCHTPHTSLAAKYAVKAINGWNHSVAFTTGNFHEPLQISPMNLDVAKQNCLHCHGNLTSQIAHVGTGEPLDCLKCHAKVGHDR